MTYEARRQTKRVILGDGQQSRLSDVVDSKTIVYDRIEQMEHAVDKIQKKALELTMMECVEKLKEIITEVVYESWTASDSSWVKEGKRTYQFRESWVVRSIGDGYSIRQDLRKMPWRNGLIHIDKWELADIIENGVGNPPDENIEKGDRYYHSSQKFRDTFPNGRPYWSEFMTWYNKNFKIIYKRYFDEIMNNR